MTEFEGLTTGQVSGMTGFSFMTIYRYTKLYGEFFSPTVARHTRGRRWTEQDIILLMTIKACFDRRMGEEGTHETLKSGWRISDNPASQPDTLEAFGLLYASCITYQKEAQADRKAAHELTLKLGQLQRKMLDDHQLVMDLTKAVKNLSNDVQILATRKTSLITLGRK